MARAAIDASGARVMAGPASADAAAAASTGLPSEGRERSCRPATARPRQPQPPTASYPGRLTLSPAARACDLSHVQAVRPGAPKACLEAVEESCHSFERGIERGIGVLSR